MNGKAKMKNLLKNPIKSIDQSIKSMVIRKNEKKKKFSHSFPRNKMHENFPFIPFCIQSTSIDMRSMYKNFLDFFVPDTIGFE